MSRVGSSLMEWIVPEEPRCTKAAGLSGRGGDPLQVPSVPGYVAEQQP